MQNSYIRVSSSLEIRLCETILSDNSLSYSIRFLSGQVGKNFVIEMADEKSAEELFRDISASVDRGYLVDFFVGAK